MKGFVAELSRLSLVVGFGLCAGWSAGGALLGSPASQDAQASAQTSAQHLPAPQSVQAPIQTQAVLTPSIQLAAAPAAPVDSPRARPSACSLDPRDYADDRPIGSPEAADHKKRRGVACG